MPRSGTDDGLPADLSAIALAKEEALTKAGLQATDDERQMTDAIRHCVGAPTNSMPPEKSTARQAIEGFTGKTAVDTSQRTKTKVKNINEQRQKNFEEIPP